jgi:regulator of protease activity HflC (stomatin/prohibitin superfamily)
LEVTPVPFVRANPNQFLLTGRQGKLQNQGSAVQKFLLPGTVYVLVPSTKQEAAFGFTQETRDGIPLRFKGIVIYRVTDPIAAAQHFDFANASDGAEQISELLTHVVLGELRHAVSHMTMAECIEQRKTTLSGVVQAALDATLHQGEDANEWGIEIEVAQVAQVYIVDAELRQQLEAETRNEIKLKSDQSEIQTAEEAQLTAMASQRRVAEEQLATDRENLRRREQLFQAEMAAEEARITAEAPIRLLRAAREAEALRAELETRELANQLRSLEVEGDQLRARAEQALRMEILPVEQTPKIVEAAAKVFQNSNLSLYAGDADLVGHLAPLFEVMSRSVRQSLGSSGVSQERTAG